MVLLFWLIKVLKILFEVKQKKNNIPDHFENWAGTDLCCCMETNVLKYSNFAIYA